MSRDGPTEVRRLIQGADPFKPEPPRPLMRGLPPADPFPIDALGDVLNAAARAINDRIQAPLAICGQSVLAVAALATQGHADIELPIGRPGQAKPLSGFFVTVAATGERKSVCDREAMWPVTTREAALREARETELSSYGNANLRGKGRARSRSRLGRAIGK
jgi:hypothetical protein